MKVLYTVATKKNLLNPPWTNYLNLDPIYYILTIDS